MWVVRPNGVTATEKANLMPRRPCIHPGCPALALPGKSRCQHHQAILERDRNTTRGTSSQRGYTSRWQRIRLHHLHLEPACRHCGTPGDTTNPLTVDHRDGDTSNNHPANLQTLCRRCHGRKDGARSHTSTPRP